MGKHYQGRGRKEKLTKAQQKQLHDMIAGNFSLIAGST